ncbi:MAG: hypothetical protein POELPBGB_02537 [Bacteroidia bacterium]|nr:hypothetical protein [Bacteroidia bacterium]
MKSVVFSFLALLFTGTDFSAKADACDSLEVVYFGFNPFHDYELVVYVHNTNTVDFFSYPGFKLLNANGDTVATETVNFFGIGEYSAHRLLTSLTDIQPGEVFNGTLLLYTGFYDSLVCTFPVSQVLIPSTGCTYFTVYSSDFNGTVEQPVNWEVTDAQGNVVFSGIHDYAADTFYYNSPVCLENGCYQLTLTASSPLEGMVQAGVNFLAFNIDTYLHMDSGATSASFTFGVYECDSVNSVAEYEGIDFRLFPNPASTQITLITPIKEQTNFVVYDMSCRRLCKGSFLQNTTIVTTDFAKGVYFIELISKEGIGRQRFIQQ